MFYQISNRGRPWQQHIRVNAFAEPFIWRRRERRSHGILPLPVVPLVVWVNAFTLWKPEAVRITKGKDQLATYQKTEISQRQYCRKCGGHLMTTHPTFGLVDIFSASVQVCMSITRRPYYQCVTVFPS